MRPLARFVVALFALPSILSILGAASCSGDDAVGIDACRKIETARCEASTACGATADDATYCAQFYRDQCLHGLQNTKADPTTAMADACVAAVQATATCARASGSSMATCPAAPLIASTDPSTVAPCTILQHRPELLSACAFVAASADAGTFTPDAGDTSDAGDAGSD